MADLAPYSSLAGGALVGAAAGLLLLANGRIAGVSGVVGGLLRPARGDVAWRAAFAAGLLAGGLALRLLSPGALGPAVVGLPTLILAGLLVGFGAQLGSGCTSGHGVCGVGRLSPRSLVATVTFVLAGMATTAALRHLVGGAS